MSQPESGAWKALKTFWRGINLVRLLIINLLFFGFLALVLFVVLQHRKTPVAEPNHLVLEIGPAGRLVEQTHNPVGRAIAHLEHIPSGHETGLADVLRGIRLASRDPHIRAIVLDTDRFTGGGMPEIDSVRRALLHFEKTGKPVIAIGRSYDTSQYLLASVATQIDVSPEGGVIPSGFGLYEPYLAQLLKRLGVDVYVVRVGKYKDAVEPLLRNHMTAPSRKQWTAYLTGLWTHYEHEVAVSRDLPPDAVGDYVGQAVSALRKNGGDMARYALAAHLVTAIQTRPEIHAALRGLVGPSGAGRTGFHHLGLMAYLALHPKVVDLTGKPEIALIHADGDIVSGSAPPGEIGSRSLVNLIRAARRDTQVKALVLRVNSPGGSAAASDEILHAIVAFEQTGRPVVVSMGDMAASGGYWISMAADRIYAEPTTLTGSIGIFGIFPDVAPLLAKIGISVHGVGTTPLSGQFNPMRPLSQTARTLFRIEVLHGYQDFIDQVAHFRHLTPQRVNAIGRGHIWIGRTAIRLGLVNDLGGLSDALRGAAQLSHLVHYQVVTFQKPLPLYVHFLLSLSRLSPGGSSAAAQILNPSLPGWLGLLERLPGMSGTGSVLRSELGFLKSRRGVYAYCLGCRVALLH